MVSDVGRSGAGLIEVGASIRAHRQHAELSQEALAEALDISVRHLSFLENDKAQPSFGLTQKLIETLPLSLADSNRLLRSLGFAVHVQLIDILADEHATIRQQIERALQATSQVPALAMDCIGNILSMNDLAEEFMRSIFSPAPASSYNFFELLLTTPDIDEKITNWSTLLPQLLAHIRNEQRSLKVGSAEWLYLEQLLESHDAVAIPALEEAVASFDIQLTIAGTTMHFISQPTTLGTPYDGSGQGIRIETFYPQ